MKKKRMPRGMYRKNMWTRPLHFLDLTLDNETKYESNEDMESLGFGFYPEDGKFQILSDLIYHTEDDLRQALK